MESQGTGKKGSWLKTSVTEVVKCDWGVIRLELRLRGRADEDEGRREGQWERQRWSHRGTRLRVKRFGPGVAEMSS